MLSGSDGRAPLATDPAARSHAGMRRRNTPSDATLVDVLVDGFEKNEVMYGFHWRSLPMPDEEAARRKFASLVAEALSWKGAPLRDQRAGSRQLVGWKDLEIRQAGRGIMVRIRTPAFSDWWNAPETWFDDPMGPLFAWLAEERHSVPSRARASRRLTLVSRDCPDCGGRRTETSERGEFVRERTVTVHEVVPGRRCASQVVGFRDPELGLA
jgi:hypothetical protein